MSDTELDDVPDVSVCEARCDEFASITGTDEACAQFYLQDHGWDVQKSVNAYYDATAMTGSTGDTPTATSPINSEMADALRRSLEDESVKEFKFMTWNIDGLDERNANVRIKAVVDKIKSEDADVVHLQEVVLTSAAYLLENLTDYQLIPGDEKEYFCVTLLKKATVTCQHQYVKPFLNSVMGRNLIVARVTIGGVPLMLLNSHLESTSQYSEERVWQLKIGFELVKNSKPEDTVIFAGDLNLRDKEITDIGGLPETIKDLWIECGKRKECEFTWDTARNVNSQLTGKFKPRLRFDRVYFRSSTPKQIRPKHFGLVGIEKVRGAQCFPSDHWGIVVHFKIGN